MTMFSVVGRWCYIRANVLLFTLVSRVLSNLAIELASYKIQI